MGALTLWREEPRALGASDRRELAAVLRAAPWCWPSREAEPQRFAEARELTGCESVPALRAGQALLVSVQRNAASLWRIGPPEPASFDQTAPFDERARRAWEEAALALPRSLPVLWRPVGVLRARLPRAVHLGTYATTGALQPPARLEGASFGLAFFLAQASEVLDCPLPADVVGCATVDAHGALGPVEALDRKLEAVARLAPGVEQIVVAATQRDEARRIADELGAPWRIRGESRADRALAALLSPERVAERLVDAGADPETRSALVRSFYRLAMGRRDAVHVWRPVARAARLALDRWPDLDPAERYWLRFAEAVALRHDGKPAALPLPERVWLERLPRSERTAHLAHLVQQAADTGSPEPEAIGPLLEHELPATVHEAFAPQLQLLGALARLEAVTGRPRHALERQLAVLEGWLERFRPEEASYPLAEAYRLAGALGDEAAFERAAQLETEISALGAFPGDGAQYVEVARGRALAALGRFGQARELLEPRLEDPATVDHVAAAACRALAAIHAATGEGAARRAVLEQLEQFEATGERVNGILTSLDDALRAGRDAEAARWLEALAATEPEPTGHLRRAAGRLGEPEAAYVARFYPY
ncbi:MAG: hypothetical protein D6776_10505 [Planctomycetota bacterium]|nr:MAG: hypothetical protein D6776_10505 [Planctomycetota bacterium]